MDKIKKGDIVLAKNSLRYYVNKVNGKKAHLTRLSDLQTITGSIDDLEKIAFLTEEFINSLVVKSNDKEIAKRVLQKWIDSIDTPHPWTHGLQDMADIFYECLKEEA